MFKITNYQKLFYLNLFKSLNTLLPIITLFYLHRGATIFDVFLLSVIYAVVTVVFEIPTGIIGDKFGRKTSIILGCLCMLLHGIFYIIAHSFLMIAIGFSFFVIAMTFFSGSIEAFMYDSLKDEGKEHLMNKYFGKYHSVRNLTAIFIPFIAAFIAKDLLESQFLILLYAALAGYIISLLIAFSLKEPKHYMKQKSSVLFKKAVKLFKTNKILLRLSLNKALAAVLAIIYWRIWQPHFNSNILIPIFWFGIFMSVSNLISYLGKNNLIYLEKKIGVARFINLTAYLPLIAAIVFVFTNNQIIHTIILFCVLIPLSIRDPLFSRYVNTHIRSENRATALSVMSIMKSGIEVPIAILVGLIAAKSLVYAIIPGIALVMIAVVFFHIKDRHVRCLPQK